MTDTILVRVDACLIPVLEEIKRESAIKIQKVFKLQEPPELYGTFASKVLAGFYQEKKQSLQIKVHKNGKGYAIVEVLS